MAHEQSWPFGPFVLGCGTFGGIGGSPDLIGLGLDEQVAHAVLDEAVTLGIQLLDTAERYAAGASESMIGRWLSAQSADVRNQLAIATKVAPPWVDGSDGGFDLPFIEEKLAGSLERLGVEQVELLMLHAPDPDTPIDDTLEALESLRSDGRCLRLGACNVAADELVQAIDAANRLGVRGVEVVQNGYSLLTLEEEAGVRAVCGGAGIRYTPYSPLAGGVLTGKYERNRPPEPDSRVALRAEMTGHLDDRTFDAIDRLRAGADQRGVEPGALALAWLVHHPDVTAPVVGPSRQAPHLDLVRLARDVPLTPDEFSEIGHWFSYSSAELAEEQE